MGLAAQLKEATMENHKRAENAGFIKDLMQGRVDRPLYTRHISTLYDLYNALEAAMEAQAHHPTVADFCFSELWRAKTLGGDLKFFSGPEILSTRRAESGEGTRKYCEHLRKIGAEKPGTLDSPLLRTLPWGSLRRTDD